MLFNLIATTLFAMLVLCSSATGQAPAPDPCREVLDHGIYNISVSNLNESERQSFEHWLWHQSYDKLEGGATLPIPAISTILGASFTKESFEQWREGTKGKYEKAVDQDIVAKFIDHGVVDAWKECRKGAVEEAQLKDRLAAFRRGLVCSLVSKGPDMAELTVEWRPTPSPVPLRVTQISVIGGNVAPGDKTFAEKGGLLKAFNQRQFAIKRDALSGGGYPALNVKVNSDWMSESEWIEATPVPVRNVVFYFNVRDIAVNDPNKRHMRLVFSFSTSTVETGAPSFRQFMARSTDYFALTQWPQFVDYNPRRFADLAGGLRVNVDGDVRDALEGPNQNGQSVSLAPVLFTLSKAEIEAKIGTGWQTTQVSTVSSSNISQPYVRLTIEWKVAEVTR